MGQLFGLLRDGATFDVKVMASPQRVAWLKRRGLPFPSPIVVCGLIDTGASSTCIDEEVVRSLDLNPSNYVAVHTPSTMGVPVHRNAYDVSIVFGDSKPDPRTYTLELVATELASQGILLLVGRDILKRCIFQYDGPNGIFDLRY